MCWGFRGAPCNYPQPQQPDRLYKRTGGAGVVCVGAPLIVPAMLDVWGWGGMGSNGHALSYIHLVGCVQQALWALVMGGMGDYRCRALYSLPTWCSVYVRAVE